MRLREPLERMLGPAPAPYGGFGLRRPHEKSEFGQHHLVVAVLVRSRTLRITQAFRWWAFGRSCEGKPGHARCLALGARSVRHSPACSFSCARRPRPKPKDGVGHMVVEAVVGGMVGLRSRPRHQAIAQSNSSSGVSLWVSAKVRMQRSTREKPAGGLDRVLSSHRSHH